MERFMADQKLSLKQEGLCEDSLSRSGRRGCDVLVRNDITMIPLSDQK